MCRNFYCKTLHITHPKALYSKGNQDELVLLNLHSYHSVDDVFVADSLILNNGLVIIQ